jgi:hypothetical protein
MSDASIELTAYIHALATSLMAGLVWFVQIVHYPLFASVPEHGFAAYESRHQSRTTLIVAPLMLTEAALAGVLLLVKPQGVSVTLVVVNAALLAAVWGLTFFGAVPRHARLSSGFDAKKHAALVAINWPRTIAWTAKAIVALLIARAATIHTAI